MVTKVILERDLEKYFTAQKEQSSKNGKGNF